MCIRDRNNIIRIGLPAGLQSTMYSISNLIIQASINSFGTDTIAAWTAYGKVDGIFWMIMGAYGVAIDVYKRQILNCCTSISLCRTLSSLLIP